MEVAIYNVKIEWFPTAFYLSTMEKYTGIKLVLDIQTNVVIL